MRGRAAARKAGALYSEEEGRSNGKVLTKKKTRKEDLQTTGMLYLEGIIIFREKGANEPRSSLQRYELQ